MATTSPKSWKNRHQGILLTCRRGHTSRGKLKKAVVNEIIERYGVSKSTIYRVWGKYKDVIMKGDSPKIERKTGAGRKPKHARDDVASIIKTIPISKRKTLRSLSHESKIPTTMLHRYLRQGFLSRATSTIKPLLTPAGMEKRLLFCKSFVDPDGKFNNMLSKVHIDEKWFHVKMTDQ